MGSKSQRKSITGKGRRKSRSSKKVRNCPQRKRKRMAIENQRTLKVRNQENRRKRKQKKQGKKKGKKSKANKGKRRKKNKTRKLDTKKSKNRKKNRKKKLLKKMRKSKSRRGKKKTGRKISKQTDSCQSLDCLNNLVQTLKVEKDTVRNFLAQRKRVKNKLQLMQNKQDKKGERWGTAMFLEKRLGETKDHKGNNSNGPLCKGVYNSKMGKMASDVAHTLEDCNATIEEACKNHIEVNKTELDEMDACEKDYREYKAESELCQNKTNDC